MRQQVRVQNLDVQTLKKDVHQADITGCKVWRVSRIQIIH